MASISGAIGGMRGCHELRNDNYDYLLTTIAMIHGKLGFSRRVADAV
jgi:hypothetical protein